MLIKCVVFFGVDETLALMWNMMKTMMKIVVIHVLIITFCGSDALALR